MKVSLGTYRAVQISDAHHNPKEVCEIFDKLRLRLIDLDFNGDFANPPTKKTEFIIRD